MTLTATPTIAVFPEEKLTLDQKIEKWVWQLCRSLEENYKSKYPDKGHMGVLQFQILHMIQLGPAVMRVTGSWHLDRDMGNAGGYFTLLWKKIKGQWLIIADHSS